MFTPKRRLLAVAAMAIAAASTSTVLTAVPAQADHTDCAYPYVCLWDVFPHPDRKYQYRDFGRQPLAVQNAVDHIYNTRRDDTVRLWTENVSGPNSFICIAPGGRHDLARSNWQNKADYIEIRDQATC